MITKRERLVKTWKHLRNVVVRRDRRQTAIPVLIFGEQRSGTNMLLRCFDRCPSTAMYNETDDDAFKDYELRDLEIVRQLIARSPASHVVLKPTADGNRARNVMENLPGARAIWIYRNFQDVIGSALVQFRETSIEYLTRVSSRSPDAKWRSINITDEDVATISGHLQRGISEPSARALIWLIRNGFYFRLGLDQRTDVLLLNYEELVRNPVVVVERAYRFVCLDFSDEFTRGVFASSVGRRPAPEIDPVIQSLCAAMLARLDSCVSRQAQR